VRYRVRLKSRVPVGSPPPSLACERLRNRCTILGMIEGRRTYYLTLQVYNGHRWSLGGRFWVCAGRCWKAVRSGCCGSLAATDSIFRVVRSSPSCTICWGASTHRSRPTWCVETLYRVPVSPDNDSLRDCTVEAGSLLTLFDSLAVLCGTPPTTHFAEAGPIRR
jgi:hypothetical protein